MNNIKPVLLIFLLASAICGFSCRDQKSAWKGTITTENGVTIVQNPKEPMYGEDVLVLEEDLSIGDRDSTAGGDFLISRIRALTADDDGNIYVLDSKDNHILAFDNTGRYLRTFGREGQGPGEFSYPLTISLTNRTEIVVEDSRRNLVYFSTEGEYLRSLSITKTGVARVTIDSHGNILGVVIKRDNQSPRYEIQKFDPAMNLIQSLDSTPTPTADNQGLNLFSGSVYFAFDKDDRVVCGVSDRYEIKIYDTKGNLVKKIMKDYDPVEITEEEIKEEKERMPPEMKLVFPKYHTPFQWISTDDEGRIFVMTSEHIPGGEGYFHDVFDHEGRFIAKIPFRYRPFLIKDKKYYTIREDEEGFHVVKRYNVNWRIDE